MCLFTKQPTLKIAENDITCYKAIRISMSDYVTWYWGEQIPERAVNGLEPYAASGEAVPRPHTDTVYPFTWGGGLVHSFRDLGACENLKGSTTLIYRCTIPKGAEYVEGVALTTVGRPCVSYASKKLVFNERVYDGLYDTLSQW